VFVSKVVKAQCLSVRLSKHSVCQ